MSCKVSAEAPLARRTNGDVQTVVGERHEPPYWETSCWRKSRTRRGPDVQIGDRETYPPEEPANDDRTDRWPSTWRGSRGAKAGAGMRGD